MKNTLLTTITACFFFTCVANAQKVFTSDVNNFWKAYDKITKTKDSILQKKLLEDLYFSKEQKV